MAHAEKCPICRGSGTIEENYTATAPLKKTCHGYGGKGWIVVQDKIYPAKHLDMRSASHD